MGRFTTTTEVASIVTAAPRTARVFERHGIDYCCGGRVPLEEACAAKGLDAAAVLGEVEAAAGQGAPERDLSQAGVPEVVQHILDVHHAYVKREIPRLDALMEKVVRVHGPHHPDLFPDVQRTWRRIAGDLEPHLAKEEEILFPLLVARAGGRPTRGPMMDPSMPIRVMEAEHEEVGEAYAHLREITHGFVPPEEACGSWRALWAGLEEFEEDLHRHIHLENHVLFPKALELTGTTPW